MVFSGWGLLINLILSTSNTHQWTSFVYKESHWELWFIFSNSQWNINESWSCSKFIIKDFEHTIGNIIKWISKAHFCVHLCMRNEIFWRHYWEHPWKTSNVKLGTLPRRKLYTCLKHLRGKTKEIVGIIVVHHTWKHLQFSTKWIPFMTTSRIFPTM